jgi:hypothetical protein
MWVSGKLGFVDCFFTHFPSGCLKLFCIVTINAVVVMGVFVFIGASLAGMPNGYVISTVAAHVPIIVIFDGVGSIVALLLWLDVV